MPRLTHMFVRHPFSDLSAARYFPFVRPSRNSRTVSIPSRRASSAESARRRSISSASFIVVLQPIGSIPGLLPAFGAVRDGLETAGPSAGGSSLQSFPSSRVPPSRESDWTPRNSPPSAAAGGNEGFGPVPDFLQVQHEQALSPALEIHWQSPRP